MDITLINPGWQRGSLWSVKCFKLPPFNLALIAALTPAQHNVEILDENVENINLDKLDTDIAGITVMTPLALRAYEISSILRERGITTVLGGIHPSILPDEALSYCDSVVIGEAEGTWQKLLYDIEKGTLQKKYVGRLQSLEGLPSPQVGLLKKHKYFETNLVQTTRGVSL